MSRKSTIVKEIQYESLRGKCVYLIKVLCSVDWLQIIFGII